MIKVSVIVPIYNVEQYLKRCIDSLLAQSLKEIEIILVDDGSPDKCPEICDQYGTEYKNIIVIHKKNAGLGMARNTGLEVARGKYVAFVDSDDYVDKEMYEKLYHIAEEKKADIVISGGFISELPHKTTVTRETQTTQVFSGEKRKELSLKMTGSLPKHIWDYEYAMSVCKGIYLRNVILDNNIRFVSERELISEDLLFHYDVFEHANQVIIIPDCFYHYCLNIFSITKTYCPNRFQRNIQFYRHIVSLLKERDYPDVGKLYASRLLIASARVAIEHVVMYSNKSYRQKIQEIERICAEAIFEEVLNTYPICKLPIKQCAITYAMKLKCCTVIYWLVKFNKLIK